MKGFKKCNNGHFFKEELHECPYCPKTSDSGPNKNTELSDKTQISGFTDQTSSGDDGKTQVFGSGGGASQSTQIFGGGATQSTQIFGGGKSEGNKRDLNRTFIQGMEESVGGENVLAETPRATRKITGWIISYTLDAMGLDFRIYEGNNTIGRDPENTITIVKDTAISGKHVTILYRMGKFYLKDEMAVNGTFLNGELIEIGKPYELTDGDEISLGGTTLFKFKSAV